MSTVEKVADVVAVAESLRMRQMRLVPDLAGAWSLPGVELVCSNQGWGLSLAVFATVPGAPADLWRWRANVTGGIDPEALAALVVAASKHEERAAS